MGKVRNDGQPTPAAQPNEPWPPLAGAWLAWAESLLLHNRLPLSGDVTQWIRTWGEAVSQIGLLNVNVAGSGDPRLEKMIGARYSYGRQLGRMLDMLDPLVRTNEESLRQSAGNRKVEEFQAMVSDIARLKSRVADVVHDVSDWQATPTFEQDLTDLLQRLAALMPGADLGSPVIASQENGRRLPARSGNVQPTQPGKA